MSNNLIVTRNEIISVLNAGYAKDTEVRSGLGFVFVSLTALSYRLINKPMHSFRFVISLILTRELHTCCCANKHLARTSKWPSVCTVSGY